MLEPLADAKERQRDLYFIEAARGANAKAFVTNERVVVIEGSEIATSTVPSMASAFINQRQKLIDQGVIKKTESWHVELNSETRTAVYAWAI